MHPSKTLLLNPRIMDINIHFNRNQDEAGAYRASFLLSLDRQHIDFFESMLLVARKLKDHRLIDYSSDSGPSTCNLFVAYNKITEIEELLNLFVTYSWLDFRFFTQTKKRVSLPEVQKKMLNSTF